MARGLFGRARGAAWLAALGPTGLPEILSHEKSGVARIRAKSVTAPARSAMFRDVAHPLDLARERLERLLGLDSARASRAVSETLDCLGQEVDEFIADRHRELRAQGARNEVIYETIAREIPTLRFAAPKLSARQ